jgi:branched-chain amino acid aminotransferase group I
MSAPIPLEQRSGWIWMDGKFVPWSEARVHVLSHGLHYGTGIFEGERAYHGRVFKLTQHNERFHHSGKMAGFEVPYSVAELDAITDELLKKNGIGDAYVRPVAWRGAESLNVTPTGCSVRVAIAAWEWKGLFVDVEKLEKGIAVTWSPWRRHSALIAPVNAKIAGQYVTGAVSRSLAQQKGFDDVLLLDLDGNIAEASGANFFLVQNGELHTPIPDCALNGITRQTVIELAKQAGIPVIERRIRPGELETADELFLTGSAAEVAPIGRFDDRIYKVGPITQQMAKAYAEHVRRPMN